MSQRKDPADEFMSGDTADLENLRASLTGSMKRRLALWVVRWVLSFGAIGVIVYFWPTLSWLFWAGAAVAVTSFVVTLSIHAIGLKRIDTGLKRIDTGRRQIEEYERLAQEAEKKGDGTAS